MQLGLYVTKAFFVPEGHMTIVRRFNAGTKRERQSSPEGTVDPARLSHPFGTYTSATSNPALKRRVILNHPSGMMRFKS